jgi:hypothetical protein
MNVTEPASLYSSFIIPHSSFLYHSAFIIYLDSLCGCVTTYAATSNHPR